MTAQRSRKQEVKYRKHLKNAPQTENCSFCTIKKGDDIFVGETKHFRIIKNLFPYSVWDQQDVIDHLMIVPKIHTETFAVFTPEISAEYVELLSEFENQEYSSYTRAAKALTKSVPHLHTHLIKLSGKYKRLVFFARRPYIRLAK